MGTRWFDVLCPRGGADRVDAGRSDDLVYARDGVRDPIRCGPGQDTVFADGRDRLGPDCERVRRSSEAPG